MWAGIQIIFFTHALIHASKALGFKCLRFCPQCKHRPKFLLCREILSSEGCHTTFMWGKEYVNVNAKLCAHFEDDGRLMSVWLLWCMIPIERSCSCIVGDFIFMFYFFFLFCLYRFGLTLHWFNLHQSSLPSIILSPVYFMVSISPGSRCVYNMQIID